MNENAERREFSYDDREAEIVARCETGAGDLPRTMTVWFACGIVAVALLRIIRNMPLPTLQMLGCYAAAITAWVLFTVFINYRIRQTAAELKKRILILYFGDDGIELYEYTTELRYHCRFEDIELVERGDSICRVTSRTGRICLPLRLLSAEEIRKLDASTERNIRRDWM